MKLFVFISLFFVSSISTANDSDCSALVFPEFILNGQVVADLELHLQSQDPENIVLPARDFKIDGVILEARILDAKLRTIYNAKNLEFERADARANLASSWNANLNDFYKAAYRFVTEDVRNLTLEDLNTHANMEELFDEIFYDVNNIRDPSKSMFEPAGLGTNKFDSEIALDSDGRLLKVNLGDLPKGIYSLRLSYFESGSQPEYVEALFVVRD